MVMLREQCGDGGQCGVVEGTVWCCCGNSIVLLEDSVVLLREQLVLLREECGVVGGQCGMVEGTVWCC